MSSITLTAYVFTMFSLLFSDSIMVKVIEIRRSRDSKILHYCTNCNCNASRNLLELLCEKYAIHQLFLGGKKRFFFFLKIIDIKCLNMKAVRILNGYYEVRNCSVHLQH